MSEYIQVGVTAMRDPATGEFLPSVPLYIREEDREKVAVPVYDEEIIKTLAEKFRAYKKEERKQKKSRPVRISTAEIGERLDAMMEAYGEEQKKTR